MARVLVIEDEADLRELLRYSLEQARHVPSVAEGGLEGLRLARQDRPDLVLLDLMLPDLSGKEVCRSLKAHAATRGIPVIMLTAKGEAIDRILGFELGAEDYVVKPFSLRELLLRMEVALRRTATAPTGCELACGPVRLDKGAHRAWVHGREVSLTALELRVLWLLVERRGRVQSRDALLEGAWGCEADLDLRTVDSHVRNLREKLGEAGVHLQTIRGAGYRFRESLAD